MTINQIEQTIKDLQKQKKQIQLLCDHKQRSLKFMDEKNIVKIFCSNCNKELGYPNQQDLNKFFSQTLK